MRISFVSVFLLWLSMCSFLQGPAFAVPKSYIVYLGSHEHGPEATLADFEIVSASHYELLGSVCKSVEKAREKIFYSYTKNINGFAATLEEEEATELANHPDVIAVFLDKSRKLQTTHSWSFLGLEKDGVIPDSSLWVEAGFGQDVIIANIDTGVWPEAKSFSNEALGPVPSKWRGSCGKNDTQGVRCNRKLIGARFFNGGYVSSTGPLNSSFYTARDHDGHGTHTLSTAAGNFVLGASVLVEGKATLKGGSPNARAAAYKACWPDCFDTDTLAAFESAIYDGVDVISVSLGTQYPADFSEDALAIGAFHAVRRGITVVMSAGNAGPDAESVSNVAPWFASVGASTIDRDFTTTVALGNRKHITGESLHAKGLPAEKFYPLISAAASNAANASAMESQYCKLRTVDPKKVKEKILVCLRGGDIDRLEKGYEALRAGAVGMILVNSEAYGSDLSADPHVLPAAHVSYSDGLAIYAYMNSTKNPGAFLTPAKMILGTKPAPSVAAFSSRGPNPIEPSILKPDIIAPGVSIIAASTPAASPSGEIYDNRMLSGTSMAAPHVAGVVGLLRALHRDWSPAAILSAIITTASSQGNDKRPIIDLANKRAATPFDVGAGHVCPSCASDPGLIYDLTTDDYLNFLCAIGYEEKQLKIFALRPYSCPKSLHLLDFNYPSITVPYLNASITFSRTVKNVGPAGTYFAWVEAPKGVTVSVEPTSLKFVEIGEEKTFKVTLDAARDKVHGEYVFGGLIWSDGVHHVRSPLVVMHV